MLTIKPLFILKEQPTRKRQQTLKTNKTSLVKNNAITDINAFGFVNY